MAVNLSPLGGAGAQFFDNSGQVLTGGLLYTYLAGTTTPATTYTQANGITAHPNPIVLNAAGRVPDSGEIWLSDGVLYKFALKDSNGVQIATYDNISGINSNFVAYTSQSEVQTATQGQTVFTLADIQYTPATNNLVVYVNGSKQVEPTNYVETDSTTVTFVSGLNVGDVVEFSTATPVATNVVDASNVSYNEGDTGAINQNVQDRLRQYVSVKDFGAVGDGITDDAAAISTAIDNDRAIYFPPGTYLVKSSIIKSNLTNCKIYGAGAGISVIKTDATATFSNSVVGFVAGSYIEISGITFDQNNNTTLTATWPLFIAITTNNISVKSCAFINVTYIGLGLNQCNDFWVEDNYLEHNTAISTTNYNINVSSPTTNLSRRGVIKNNISLRSANIAQGRDIIIDGNIALSSKYGAGWTTGGDAGFIYGGYTVINNICNSGSGVDADGVNVAGMEIGGVGVVVSNNTCNQNGGAGIANLARNAIISNNVCLGNGQNSTATDEYRSGILMGYVDASYGAHYCTVSGNRCGDDGSTRQKYGYYEQGSAINNVALMANNFANNITAETFIQSTNGFYETNVWTAWTPTVTSTTGTITTVGTVTAKYRLEPKTVFFNISATITTNGTGNGSINITLPPIFGGAANGNQSCYGRENGTTGKALVGIVLNGTQGINVTYYDATYPGANGNVIQIQGFYEIT